MVTVIIVKDSTINLFSKEGVIQGDPVSMILYAIGTIPMIQKLSTEGIQIWYADDAPVIGELPKIYNWLNRLLKIGPLFGYFPEPTKCHLVVEEPYIALAKELFKDLGIPVSTSGRLLGGVVGDTQGAMSFVSGKVNNWSDHIHKLPSIALTQPQAAYIALIKSLQCEWIYL